jgi:hypothetical protein
VVTAPACRKPAETFVDLVGRSSMVRTSPGRMNTWSRNITDEFA